MAYTFNPLTGTFDFYVSGGGIGGTIAAGQVAYGTATDEIGGNAAWTFDPNSGSPFDTLFSSTAVANAYTQEIFGPLDGPNGLYGRGFSEDGVTWTYPLQMDNHTLAWVGNVVNGGVSAFTAFNVMAGVPDDITSALRTIVQLNLGGGTMPSDQWLTEINTEGVEITDGTVPLTAAIYQYPPDIAGDAHVGMHTYIWQNDLMGADIDNPYYLWMDPQGVLRYKHDASHDSVAQAVLGFYNPLFTKYTPGAVNFERYTEYWDGNIINIGAEAGGTGSVRPVNIIGASVTISGLKYPTSDNTAGYVVTTNGAGVLSLQPSGGGLTVGTTAISSGTTTRILYDNAGVLGEYTLTGTGTVVGMQTDPAFLNTLTLTRTSIGVTSTDGVILTNTTAAAAGAQQYSPRLRLTGQGWKTTATAASQTVDWILENQPVQGSTNPTGLLVFSSQVNAGGYTSRLEIGTSGSINVPAGGSGTVPAIGVAGRAGISSIGSTTLDLVAGGSHIVRVESSNPFVGMGSTCFLGWSNATPTSDPDTKFYRDAAASVRMGANVNGAAVSQSFGACSGITGTDKTGGNMTFYSGKGTGAGAVSSLIFQTPTVLASGTTAQSLTTRLTINSGGATFVDGITTIGGAVFHTTSSALTDGVGASAGTITNAPSVGNPTKWIGINDNGTTRYIPAW